MIFLDALFLLIVANGTPVVVAWLLGRRFDYPLDGNRIAGDGRRWLGATKTVRGILFSILVTALIAMLMGMSWRLGAVFGLLAMLGDLLSSFIKRRLGLASSSSSPGLDQLPESLIPLWGCSSLLGLEWRDILLSALAFLFLHLIFSRLLDRFAAR